MLNCLFKSNVKFYSISLSYFRLFSSSSIFLASSNRAHLCDSAFSLSATNLETASSSAWNYRETMSDIKSVFNYYGMMLKY